jgi:hypothetical protein
MMAMLGAGLGAPACADVLCSSLDAEVARAVMIIQVVPSEVVPPETGGQGMCTMTGEIVQSFLGQHPVGTVIQTRIPCTSPELPGAEPTVQTEGAWFQIDLLRATAVIELHIAPQGGPAGGSAGVVLLDGATKSPARRSACG